MEKLISRYFVPGKTFFMEDYLAQGGYEAARTAFSRFEPAALIAEVQNSNLCGLGGAGFPAGKKWGFVPPPAGKPVYLVVNADEGEPGTFKDRYILEHAPHLLLEGILIAAYANRVRTAYIYLRGEYAASYERLQKAIDEAYAKNFLGKNIFGKGWDLDVVVHRGAGAYICGEETALLESLEGKKGFPRLKPPFPAVAGLFGCPTIINNVETLSYLPFIAARGAAWFAGLGTEKNGGMRLFGVSGHVNEPGVYELPMGTPLGEILEDYAGGVRNGHRLKALVPGGLSSAVLTAEEINVKMDFPSLAAAGTMGGSGGILVMDETTCMVRALHVTMRFFAHESCGQCTPCREGTGWVERILSRILAGKGRPEDVENLLDIAAFLGGTTICALADGAAMALQSYLQKFRSEFEQHVREGKCDLGMSLAAGRI